MKRFQNPRVAVVGATGAVGRTMVEISEQPLRPGQPFQVFLAQSGRVHIEQVRLLLVCDESDTAEARALAESVLAMLPPERRPDLCPVSATDVDVASISAIPTPSQ